MLTPAKPLQFLPDIPVIGTSDCATFAGVPGTHCWDTLTGMAFDTEGNLWANSAHTNDAGTFEFAPGGSCGGAPVCPLNFTPDYSGDSAEPIGVTIAPIDDSNNPGYVMIANVAGETVTKINPTSCSGYIGHPGTCTESLFIDDTPYSGKPKSILYYQSCPNPDNDGYVEICKQSSPPPDQVPVGEIFDFTATAPFFNSGSLEVPVGECSGPVQVPSGPVTVTEAPTISVLVSDCTAISYNLLGFPVLQTPIWTVPDLNCTVNVEPGDVAQETLATVTNYAATTPGQLKICKIAGSSPVLNKEFSFNVVAAGATTPTPFTIEAGPADQGGFCELAGTFAVNTPVTVTETVPAGYLPPTITVNPAAQLSKLNSPSVVVRIGDGITEVDFTNSIRVSHLPPPTPTPSQVPTELATPTP
jgi:hypothetical protein